MGQYPFQMVRKTSFNHFTLQDVKTVPDPLSYISMEHSPQIYFKAFGKTSRACILNRDVTLAHLRGIFIDNFLLSRVMWCNLSEFLTRKWIR